MSSAPSAATRASTVGLARRRRRRRGSRPRATVPAGRVAAEHDGVLEVRQVVALEHGDVVVAEEAVDGHEDAGPALGEDVRRLGALVPGVDRHHDAAGRLQPEQGDDPLLDVGRPDRHAVTAARSRPRRTPARPRSAAAASSANESRTSPSTTASASPNRAAAARARSGSSPTRGRRGCPSRSRPSSSGRRPDREQLVGGRDRGEQGERVVDDRVGVLARDAAHRVPRHARRRSPG